ADGMTLMHERTGEAGDSLEELTRTEAELAHITGAELGPQVDATTKMFNNWKIATEDQTEALDYLFKVSQQTGVGVTQLSNELNNAGPVMRALGIDFEHAAAMIGALDKAGLDSAGIIQGMSIAWRKLAKDGQEPMAVFDSLIAKIKNAGSSAEANKLAVEAFGRGAVRMGEAIKSGSLDVDKLVESLKASKNTIAGTADSTRTFGESMEILGHKVELALAPLGKQITTVFKDFLPTIEGWIGKLTALAEKFNALDPSVKKWIAGILAASTVAGPLAIAIGGIVTALGALTGPIGLAIAAIGLLAIAYANNFGDIKTTIDDFIATVQQWWHDHGEEVKRITKEVWDKVKEIISGALE